MKKMLFAVGIALAIAASLILWGSKFATGMVHDQLVAQKITFPDKATLQADNPALAKYASQPVDNGLKAKAYADLIAGHLKKVAGGKTYSEVSEAYLKDKTNQALAGQRQTLFQGETLRGLLLNAWGWGLIGAIALYAACAFYLAAGGLVLATVVLPAPKRSKRR
ncbi:MAG TPA: hypothetical protein VL737_05300 [Candidatus Pristimantibacillus sp.]|nr:hypothetical protein [Candidatus Pristimantibacillus sp.]